MSRNGGELAAGSGRRIVIIGAGPGGLCMGIKLLDAGLDRFVILDKADGIGGTWRHNHYPGLACDVPSLLYSFSFEHKRDWTRPYATQPEILAYLEHCVEKYGLEPHLRLNTGVRGAYWDDECMVWRVITDARRRDRRRRRGQRRRHVQRPELAGHPRARHLRAAPCSTRRAGRATTT